MRVARSLLLPLLLLAVALGITWLIWDHEREATRLRLREQFDFSLREAVHSIERRMLDHEQMLRGVQGLLATSDGLDREVFHGYVGSLQIGADFSGIQAIGYAELVPNAHKEAHVAGMRRLGFAGYAIRPEGLRESHAPNTQIEPDVDHNRVELGFDAWADPVRRRAMEAARDSGKTAISGKVRMAMDGGGGMRPGVIMYMPIYAGGQRHDNVTLRRTNLVGWVFMAIRMDEFMASLNGQLQPDLGFAIYDGVEPADAALLFRSAQTGARRQAGVLAADEYLVLAGRDWMMSATALGDFEARVGRDATALIAAAGTGLSLSLALLTWLLGTGRARALRLAGEMTSELRASEEKFRAIANSTVNWEIWWGLDGKPRWINPSVREYTGYTVEECMAMPDFAGTLFHPQDIPRIAPEFKKGLQGLSGNDLEFRCVRKDGSWFWLSVSWVPIRDGKGVLSGFRTSGRDITERKQSEEARAQLEAQLRESQKMEALGTLAGGVAHDFNNILATIAGNVELARQDVAPGHAALASLEEIDKASRRAKGLVQQILAFGRRQNLERKATSLALAVVESARLLRATLPANVSLIVDCQGGAPAVLADATQVQQILLNLCGNALHAVEGQDRPGVIEIRLSAYEHVPGGVRIDLRPGLYACLAVRDNGAGMDDQTRSHIFEPFFTTKPMGKGSGLGLSVVHGIVKAHEASFEVESAPGQGSTFRIYFPAVDAPVAAVTPPAAEAPAAQGQGKSVLYVDDDEAIIFLMTRLLERRGYRVSGYTNPREALAAARANPARFDMVVTDYNMPGLSGLEVATALREIRVDLPVVLASGYITEELRQQALAAGVRELIYKPNTVDELCEAVARFANSPRGEVVPES